MKKIIFLNIALMMVFLTSCGSTNTVKKEDTKKDIVTKKVESPKLDKSQSKEIIKKDGIAYLKGDIKPYTGKDIKYYENGKKKQEAFYENGLLKGKATMWFENNQKKQEAFFVNGKPDGDFITWYENGQKKQEIFYKNGILEGKAIMWFENGQKRNEDLFEKGEAKGKSTMWYDNGQKKREGIVLNKAWDGNFIIWHKNGKKKDERFFKNGKQIGKSIVWYENGKKQQEGFYKNGVLEGKSSYWDESGKLIYENIYKDGKQVYSLERELKVLKKDPNNISALFNIGLINYNSKNYKNTIKYWKKVKKITPDNWELREGLIQMYSKLNDVKNIEKEILELRDLRSSKKVPSLNKNSYFIREEFLVKDIKVSAYEYFELKGKMPLVWRFLLSKDNKRLDHFISVGSYEITTQFMRSSKEIKEDERAYHLDGYHKNGNHSTYGIFNKKPTYDEMKKAVIEILKGKKAAQSSSNFNK